MAVLDEIATGATAATDETPTLVAILVRIAELPDRFDAIPRLSRMSSGASA